ncbi:MAG: AhpC/TSA family protein [Bacteroidetes bacterium]|nr:AhpC/TSA family protein [Bacteroidota bacterium]
MKKTLLLLSIFALIYSCNKQDPLPPNTYEISGSAKGVYNGMRVYIKLFDGKRREIIIDTAIVMNETFSFYGKVANPSLRIISINGIKGKLPFVLESGRTTIEIDKDSLFYSKVNGTKNNEDYNVFKNELKKREKDVLELRQQIIDARTNNPELVAELVVKNREKTDQSIDYLHDFIKTKPNSEFSLLLLEAYLNNYKQNIDKLKESFTLLKNVITKTPANKLIGKKIETFISLKEAKANLDIGKIAPNFTAPTADGKFLSLNDIKGKATIIDFWASWCKPCRLENPNVVRVYEKYHDKGLEIISVSLDRAGQKERWLKAIEDDNMNWHHVSNLKFWNEPVAKMYSVSAIPATFILDENGKIVAKKLRGKALEDQIASMLD